MATKREIGPFRGSLADENSGILPLRESAFGLWGGRSILSDRYRTPPHDPKSNYWRPPFPPEGIRAVYTKGSRQASHGCVAMSLVDGYLSLYRRWGSDVEALRHLRINYCCGVEQILPMAAIGPPYSRQYPVDATLLSIYFPSVWRYRQRKQAHERRGTVRAIWNCCRAVVRGTHIRQGARRVLVGIPAVRSRYLANDYYDGRSRWESQISSRRSCYYVFA